MHGGSGSDRTNPKDQWKSQICLKVLRTEHHLKEVLPTLDSDRTR